MLIVEIFDSKLQLKWERKWSFRMTQFQWGENTYVIQLGTLELPGFAGKTIAEVSFHRKDIVGDKALATIGASENPVKVYGVILNALHDVFSEYDVFYFTAEKRHSETPEEHESKVKIIVFLQIEFKNGQAHIITRRRIIEHTNLLCLKPRSTVPGGKILLLKP